MRGGRSRRRASARQESQNPSLGARLHRRGPTAAEARPSALDRFSQASPGIEPIVGGPERSPPGKRSRSDASCYWIISGCADGGVAGLSNGKWEIGGVPVKRASGGSTSLRSAVRPDRFASSLRPLLSFALSGILFTGCLAPYRLEPASGAPLARAVGAGVTLQADGDSWSGSGTTSEHSIPIWVEVSNRSDEAVRVRYSDWVVLPGEARPVHAIDLHPGHRFPAPGRTGFVDRSWLAPTGYRPPVARRSALQVYGRSDGSRPPRRHSPYWFPYGRSTTLYIAGGPRPSWDMMRLALGEGELKPGETRAGFVYFPSFVKGRGKLDLAWLVHDTEGHALGAVGVRFRVHRDGSTRSFTPRDDGPDGSAPSIGPGESALPE